MANYIKSHSNYVLKSRHQDITDGTVFERDITTIGGADNFSLGQTPIYKSNNFIITVRSDSKTANQYNSEKWEDNASGNVWTLETISGITSNRDDENDTKIVLKQDYYDFRDFAYYGSLTELFRASVTDIIARFPGELYHTDHNVYYTSSYTEDFETIDTSMLLGSGLTEDSGLTEVVNPFGIDLHSARKREDVDALKYFADGGYENYVIISGNSATSISSWTSTYYYSERSGNTETFINYSASTSSTTITSGTSNSYHPCKGEKMADITIISKSGDSYVISAWIGDNDVIYYLSNTEGDWHIRPKKTFLDTFYNESDNFEKLLINEDTNYTATFSVIRENEYGYYREFVPFEFPKGEGGYNIDASEYGFNAYTEQMVKIGEYYDEYFTDNLWRSMTHEAIKNFDWTYTREYQEGDEEEYVFGGQRMQKAIRIFAREFDEIISYINNIKSINRLTYDERSNLPDYFLTDALENSGWNVKLIYPYTLVEKDNSGNIIDNNDYTEGNCNGQLNNTTSDGTPIIREFSQDANATVQPYAYGDADYPFGYFNICQSGCNCDSATITMDGVTYDDYGKESAETFSDSVRFDENALGGKGALKNVIRNYSDGTKWTYQRGNNEFLRRLKINSPYIWRHKGTIDGIEMMLGMFGLKSERLGGDDYSITEYTSFAHRIEEKWDAVHQDYRINWLNSTKTINYRSIKTNYQGLMVSYRDEYESTPNKYIKKKPLNDQISGGVESTSDSGDCFINEDGNFVKMRYLYPHYYKDAELDGNPYFQMNGGWLSKVIDNKWNFQYDVDNNIVYSTYLSAGTSGDSGIEDNDTLYKETVRNIRRVDNLSELLSLPISTIQNGSLCYVTNIDKNSAVIDNVVYPITTEWYDNGFVSYITFVKNDGYIKVGNSKFFDTTIFVYNIDGEETMYNIESKLDGYELKAYIKDNMFICKEDAQANYSITNFQIIENDPQMSNYFVLDDVNYSDVLAQLNSDDSDGKLYTSGWKRLAYNSNEYMKINTIVNDTKGNNPHNGNMVYDNGHEYLTYFSRIFKYASDNDLFDERCFENYYDSLYEEIDDYGFSGLVNSIEDIKQYDDMISADTKAHYFGNYKTRKDDNSIDKIYIYGDNQARLSGYTPIYSGEVTTNDIIGYNIGDMDGYPNDADEVTDQIVNNKRLTIDFKLHTDWYTNQGQCEIKYIDDIVMNYLTQMIPSNTIVQIKYTSR